MGSSGTLFYLVVGRFQCMAIAFHCQSKAINRYNIMQLIVTYNQNKSNVVSEWLIYSKSSSVPKVDVMTNLNSQAQRHFCSYESVSGSRGWAVETEGSKPVCQLIHIRLISRHLLCIYRIVVDYLLTLGEMCSPILII